MLKWIKSLFTIWPEEDHKPTYYAILTVYFNNGTSANMEMKKETIETFLKTIDKEWDSLRLTCNYYGICFKNVSHYKVEYTERPELK